MDECRSRAFRYRTASTRLPIVLFVAVTTGLLFGCRDEQPLRFTDVTQEAGIDFRYTFGDSTYQNILESSGSGVTVFDYDNDGLLDLLLLNGTYLPGISDSTGITYANTPDALYRNKGDGTFEDVTGEAGILDYHWSMSGGAFDYDGDGDTDLYLVNYGPNVFFRNRGDGTFEDVTAELGLEGPETLNGFTKWSAGATFWDYDRDGLTDISVCNFLAFDPDYVSPGAPDMMPHPNEYRGQASQLYRQTEDGRFGDVTKEVGFYYPDAKCMGLTVYDFDADGDLDLFQGNDHQTNYLFRNDGESWSEVAEQTGVVVNDTGHPTGSMHGSIGDVDGDGFIDLLVTDLRYGALYRNTGSGAFEDITRVSGIAGHFEGKGQWAAALFDFDNDGDLDVFAANGTAEELILQPPLLLENDGDAHFTNVGPELAPYFTTLRSGRTSAVWDFDNDGDRDLIVSHVDLDGRPVLLRNDGGNRNDWIGFQLVGAGGPASAVGARVTVHTGGSFQTAINQWATSYLSYNDPRLHIGLGEATVVDSVIVEWISGHTDRFYEIPSRQYVIIEEGTGSR